MMVEPIKPVPGSYGLPLLGKLTQTLRFLRGWRVFYRGREEEYGSSVFRAAVGLNAVTVLDNRGVSCIFDSTEVAKSYGFGPLKPPPARIGGIVPTVFENDESHDAQKRWYLDLQRRRASSIAATFEAVSDPYFARWVESNSFDWGKELNRLMSDFLFEWMVGAKPDVRDVEGWGLEVLPRQPIRLPGQGDKPVIERMERLLAVVRSGSHWPEVAEAADNIAGLSEDEAAKQILFYLGLNAWSAMHSLVRAVIGELSNHPDILRRCVADVDAPAASADSGLSDIDTTSIGPLLTNVIRETLRLHQPAPFSYAVARDDMVIHSSSGDYAVKKGERIHGVIGCAQRDPLVFPDPDRFDPDRYADEEAVRGVVWSHGRDDQSPSESDHQCAGKDIVYATMQMFLVKLLGGYEWTLTERTAWSDVELQPANRPITPLVTRSFTTRAVTATR